MATQHLEPQNEPEAEMPTQALSPAGVIEEFGVTQLPSEEAVAPSLPSEAEIQQALARMKAKQQGPRFGRSIRNFLTRRQIESKEADHVLQMEFDDVLTVLREETRKRAKRQRLFIGIFLSIILLFVLIAVFTHDTTMLKSMGSYVSLIAMGAAASQQQKTAALAIARFDTVHAVGPLAEALEFKDKDVLPMAEKALIRLLPRMKASDAALLSPEQRAYLNRALKGKNIALTLAILKAWEQVGDSRAIEEVEKLAQGRGRGGRNEKVVEAAKDCLPALRQSAERQQLGSQLLRPSDGNRNPSDVLLRPAMPHISTDPPDQLLRPTDAA